MMPPAITTLRTSAGYKAKPVALVLRNTSVSYGVRFWVSRLMSYTRMAVASLGMVPVTTKSVLVRVMRSLTTVPLSLVLASVTLPGADGPVVSMVMVWVRGERALSLPAVSSMDAVKL